MTRIRRLVVAVAALALTTVGGAAAAAPPDRDGLVPGLPVYLALGDSIAAGQQSAPPMTDFRTTAALWKASGYTAQLHTTLQAELDCLPARSLSAQDGCRHLQYVNLARTAIPGGPGAVTTATMLADGDQVDQAVALLLERNGDQNPRNDVEVISLTVGGNDLFRPTVGACLGTTPQLCVPTLEAVFAGFSVRYSQILGELRAAAGADTVIITTTYDNPLPYCELGVANPLSAQAFGTFVLEGGTGPLGSLPLGFNDIIRAVSAQHGAVVADTFGLLGAQGHVGGTDCLHPDADGHRIIADVAAEAFGG